MVLHAGEDDFNPEGTSDSTGNAGSRVGCCVISSFVETEDI
jgi:Cu/Zn superoxide dismutase